MVFTPRNVDWWCERGILALVLATLVFAPLAFGAVYVWTFLVVEALMVGVGLLWLVRLWGGHKPKLLWPPLAWAVAAFVLYAVARYFTADVEYSARNELIRILVYAFLFLAVVCNLYDQDATETIVYTLTAVAALASSYALAQFFHHSERVWNLTSPYPGRASGTFINPDHFLGFLELVLPLPLAFLMAGRVGVVTRVLLAYAVLSILGGAAVTISRAGWVAAACGMAMLLGFLLCHRNHRLRALLVLVAVLVAGGLFTSHFLTNSPGFMRRVAKPDVSGPSVLDIRSRLDIWGATIHIWRDHPWWGVGPAQFDHRFREYRPTNFLTRPEHAHNDYLELLADWGVAGGLIVLSGAGLLIYGLARAWPHVRREENDFGSGMSSRYAFFLGAVSGLFALAVHSTMDFNLHIPATALAGVTVLALLASNVRFATKRYWLRARLPAQCAMTVVVCGLMVYWVAQGWRRAGEAYWIAQAERVKMGPDYSSEQARLLKKALDCEPKNYLTAYNIGECYYTESLDGGDDYASLAQKAFDYFALGLRLNPWDERCPLRAGMSLDWMGRHDEAEPYYATAEARDPNGDYVVGNIGWHYVQIGDYAAARQWFMRATRLDAHNETAQSYLNEICLPKLEERASGRLPMEFFNGGKVSK
jgi:O-antigen ligase